MSNVTLHQVKCFRDYVEFCRSKIREFLIEAAGSRKTWVLKEYDRQFGNLPLNVSFLLYEKNKVRGVCNHVDSNAMFAVAMVVLADSEEGKLQVSGLDLQAEQGPSPRCIVVINPGTEHEVPITLRSTNRISLVATF